MPSYNRFVELALALDPEISPSAHVLIRQQMSRRTPGPGYSIPQPRCPPRDPSDPSQRSKRNTDVDPTLASLSAASLIVRRPRHRPPPLRARLPAPANVVAAFRAIADAADERAFRGIYGVSLLVYARSYAAHPAATAVLNLGATWRIYHLAPLHFVPCHGPPCRRALPHAHPDPSPAQSEVEAQFTAILVHIMRIIRRGHAVTLSTISSRPLDGDAQLWRMVREWRVFDELSTSPTGWADGDAWLRDCAHGARRRTDFREDWRREKRGRFGTVGGQRAWRKRGRSAV